jgi:hypothetical protein
MEHQSSTTIPVAPDRLYSALADVGNLTRFIPPLKSVRRTDPDHVEVDAEYEGHEEHGQAWFRTDEQSRRVEWVGGASVPRGDAGRARRRGLEADAAPHDRARERHQAVRGEHVRVDSRAVLSRAPDAGLVRELGLGGRRSDGTAGVRRG